MREQSLAIVGIDFPNTKGPGRRFELEICRPGEPVELRREPKNPFDEHAIAVYSCRGIQLGYLKSERAVFIGTLWRQGHTTTAIFQALDTTCGWLRVAFDGQMPTLPAFSGDAAEADDSGFFPDPVYDDE
ncbi:HIRAN domain-containing protein [Sphingomonas sp. WKB10]|nr:HIRAN domain-containing protein [Sphingomonas sp. WKB10]